MNAAPESPSRRRTHLLVLGTVCLLLSACATPTGPETAGDPGPSAVFLDTVFPETGSKGQAFAVVAVNGKSVDSAFTRTARASSGQGFRLTMVQHQRQLPAREQVLTLRGSHVTAAPIHALAAMAAGTYYSVEGNLTFAPQAQGQYVVRGELKPKGSQVWIEDAMTGKRVSDVVTAP